MRSNRLIGGSSISPSLDWETHSTSTITKLAEFSTNCLKRRGQRLFMRWEKAMIIAVWRMISWSGGKAYGLRSSSLEIVTL